MRSRKLIPKPYLTEYTELRKLGVPIKKIIRDNNLDISGPHLTKLIDLADKLILIKALDIYEAAPTLNYEIINNSLFPEWLNPQLGKVQEQPENYNYSGRFPHGQWILNESN